MKEGFKLLWENVQSMDHPSEKFAYAAGVATGAVGVAAGFAFGTRMLFDWVVDRCDDFETMTIQRIMRKIDANKKKGIGIVAVPTAAVLSASRRDHLRGSCGRCSCAEAQVADKMETGAV